jgi:hypothetical protein
MLTTENLHKILISSLITTFFSQSYCAIVLKGDSTVTGESFVQPIQSYLQGGNNLLYVAAHSPGAKNFSISILNSHENAFIPIAPAQATVDSVATETNPLYNAQIDLLANISGVNNLSLGNEDINKIAAVTNAEPTTIYLINSLLVDKNNTSLPGQAELLSLRNIKDAHGEESAGIISMVGDNSKYIFAAVKGHESSIFGEGNSGIAIAAHTIIKEKQESQEQTYFRQIPAYYILLDGSEKVISSPLNNQSNSVRINNPKINMLDNAVHLNWAESLECLYAALHVQAQGTDSDGCIAVVVGSWCSEKINQANQGSNTTPPDNKEKDIIEHKFILKSLTVPSAFQPGVNNIVGGIGSNILVSIHQTRLMITSTALHYLVIFGGIGAANQTKRTVYALPVVNTRNTYAGMLAKRDAIPTTIPRKDSLLSPLGRNFVDPAIQPRDLFTAEDVAVQVGHGPVTEGDIVTIEVYNDAVYAVVQPSTGNRPGIFYSQAIFDALGRIKEWTAWKRAYTSATDYIWGATLSIKTGNLTLLTGPSDKEIHTVKQTSWNNGDGTLSEQLRDWQNSTFPTELNGIQGIFEMPMETPGLLGISLLITTGNKRIALAQTGVEHGGIKQPLLGHDLARNPAIFDNGTIDRDLATDTNAIAIAEGALAEIGIIKAAVITAYNNRGYLFVGGTDGLAVLINDQGYSWDATIGLGNNLTGLTKGSYFKKVGEYSFISKLVCDAQQGFLYVISDSICDRIDIKTSNFATTDIHVTTLAKKGYTPFSEYETFQDAVFSQSLCILGTSNGLYQSDPSSDIRTTNMTHIPWKKIPLAEGLCTARQILCISYTGKEQDLTAGEGGNIYVLDTNIGKNLAMVHRFTITRQGQNTHVIEPLPDGFVLGTPTYFVSFTGYRNWINTNGGLFFHEQDRTTCHDPLLALLPAYIGRSIRYSGAREEILPVNVEKTDIIQPILASSSSGTWFLAQNNMLSVNE